MLLIIDYFLARLAGRVLVAAPEAARFVPPVLAAALLGCLRVGGVSFFSAFFVPPALAFPFFGAGATFSSSLAFPLSSFFSAAAAARSFCFMASASLSE